VEACILDLSTRFHGEPLAERSLQIREEDGKVAALGRSVEIAGALPMLGTVVLLERASELVMSRADRRRSFYKMRRPEGAADGVERLSLDGKNLPERLDPLGDQRYREVISNAVWTASEHSDF
jgi:hypothetical protein